jgi:hypothetical protein
MFMSSVACCRAGIISSRIVLGLLKPMLYVASISLLVCMYHSLADAAILQQLAPWVGQAVSAVIEAFQNNKTCCNGSAACMLHTRAVWQNLHSSCCGARRPASANLAGC